MLKRIFYIINIVLALLLLATYVAVFIPPHIAPKLSLLPFLYPTLLIINICFIIVWIFVKWKYIIIPLICILIRVDYIPNLYQLSGTEHRTPIENSEIKVLSYNVCSFHFNTKWNEDKQPRIDQIYNYVKELNPSIISFQDYNSSKTNKESIHYKLVNELGLKYYYSAINHKNRISGNVIYSKYPIVQSGVLFPTKETSNSYIYADLELKEGQIIRIINLHLASFKLQEEDKEKFNKLKEGAISDVKENAKPIAQKLIWANERRSKEVDEIEPILSENNLPTILTGDFNDTPFSYTYKMLSKNFTDTFKSQGKGFGTTYNGDFPAYRIDYIFCDKTKFNVKSFERKKLDYSDHYPVSTVLTYNPYDKNL